MKVRSAVIEAAEKYLFHGLVEHDGSRVPLAPGVVRIEQGRNTGEGREALIAVLSNVGMGMIAGVHNIRWTVEGEQAVAFYELEVTTSDRPVLIAERFRVVASLITEIEAIFFAQPPSN